MEVRLEDIEAARVSADEARRLVEGIVTNLSRVGEVIDSATFLEKREIVRGLTHEIAFDPDTMSGEVAFYAVPRLDVILMNDKSPQLCDQGLCSMMAGEGFEPPTSGL